MKKYIGNKAFYKMVLAVVLPIMVQNGITNFVGLLDNVMVGQIGTEQMSGVSIVNQLMLVFNIGIFGAVSGAGIFGAQFFGQKNTKGIQHAFRFKLFSCAALTIAALLIFIHGGTSLIGMYLHKGALEGSIEATLHYGERYLHIMLIEMIPFAVVQAYSGTLRETGETVLPMKAGIVAVLINLCLNYLLIFGKCGFPALGVEGAAIATVISRFAEMFVITIRTHRNYEKYPFMRGIYQTLHIPVSLCIKILYTGLPLMVNEVLWAAGQAMLLQCYSVRGIAVVAGINISTTVANFFNITFISFGSAVGIIVGQLLGAGKMEEAKDTDRKLIFFAVSACFVIGGIMAMTAPLIPQIYKTSDEVKELARNFMLISAICMPLFSYANAAYFTIRSGGKTWITFLFDSVFAWVVCVPIAYFLANRTKLSIVPLYFICQLTDIIKCTIGFILIKKGVWLKNIVNQTKNQID